MYVSSKESLRKKVAAEEGLTRGELKVVGKLLDRLGRLEAVLEKYIGFGVLPDDVEEVYCEPRQD